jgi:hypothetical protein
MFKTLALTAAIGLSTLLVSNAGASPLSLAGQAAPQIETTTLVRDNCGPGRRWSNSRGRCTRTGASRAMCPRGAVWSNRRGRCIRG